MNTRTIKFENFRNLGIKEGTSLKLGSTDSENIGGLIVLLGGNNEGKSNVLAGLEALGRQKLGEDDVPNFNDYEESEVKISLEYQIKEPALIAKLKQDMGKEKVASKVSEADLEPTDFAGETFGLFFTPGSLKKGVERSESKSEDEYISCIEKLLSEQEVYAVCGPDETGDREEIRLILKDENRMLLCSAKEGGKSLKCFGVVEKRCEEIKDGERAILLACEFKVGKTQALKGYDDAKVLREHLKKSYEAAQNGVALTPKNTPAPPHLRSKPS